MGVAGRERVHDLVQQGIGGVAEQGGRLGVGDPCLLYTSDAADERSSVDLGGRRIIKKKKNKESDSTGCKLKQKYGVIDTRATAIQQQLKNTTRASR